MDVKTLLATIGHVSAATTLDIYSHVTDTMQMQAAVNIDRHIGKTDAQMPEVKQTPTATQNTPVNALCELTEANREPTPKRYAKAVRGACIRSMTTSGKAASSQDCPAANERNSTSTPKQKNSAKSNSPR